MTKKVFIFQELQGHGLENRKALGGWQIDEGRVSKEIGEIATGEKCTGGKTLG